MNRLIFLFSLLIFNIVIFAQTNNIVVKQPDEDYEIKGEFRSSGLAFVMLHGKCGYINKEGVEVVPLKYDYEEGSLYNGKHEDSSTEGYIENWYKNYVLVRVKLNGKYGFVNQKGEEIVPPKYDYADTHFFSPDWVIRVKCGNKYGLLDSNGREIVPCLYDDIEGGSLSDGIPFLAKRNGKYAYIDSKGNLKTDFIYSYASSSFGFDIGKNLAVVSIDGKYGYINEKCQIVIPLLYEFAETFYEGLAAVVKDNKVGFINEEGNVVIPYQYDVVYSKDNLGRILSWNSFRDGVAVVKKNGKWGIIDKRGDSLTDFKYERCSRYASIGYHDMEYDGKTVYIDIMGHEYDTEKERSDNFSKTIMEAAEKGNSTAQWYVSWNYYDGRDFPKDLKKSYDWCVKAANAGNRKACDGLGDKYYYGRGCENNYSEAIKWYEKAAEAGILNSQYSLGWMLEHGQGTLPDRESGIRWYKKAALSGHKQSIARLQALKIDLNDQENSFIAKATIFWHNFEPTASQKEYPFKISVKSDSKIEDVSVYVNGILTNGNFTYSDDGNNIFFDRNIVLSDGQNTIKVTVRNAGGTAVSERKIEYSVRKKVPEYQTKKKRIALVIGNANYATSVLRDLNSPLKDAEDICATLTGLGFEVKPVLKNSSKKIMMKAIKDFIKEAENKDVAIFYYSGHGIQDKAGMYSKNYLIPTDAKLQYRENLAGECVDLNDMIIKNLNKRCKASIVFVDACRTVLNLPSESDLGEVKGNGKESRGLSEQRPPKGVCVVYATSADSVAYDPRQEGMNSYFTQGLLDCFNKEADKHLEIFIKKLKMRVYEITGGRQHPAAYDELFGDFYFDPKKDEY